MSFMGHVLMKNKNGLAVDNRISQPGFHAESDAALEMAQGIADKKKKTIGGDKHYDQETLAGPLREMNIASHAAQNIHPRRHTSSVDGRTTRHEGYEVSQRKRKRIEEIFGWLKTIGLMRRPMVRGLAKMGWMFPSGSQCIIWCELIVFAKLKRGKLEEDPTSQLKSRQVSLMKLN